MTTATHETPLRKRFLVLRLAVAALALMLGACASTGGSKPSSAKAAPEVRAIERWNLLIAGKADEAWEYLSPGARSTKSREAYQGEMTQRPVRWEKAEPFEKPECASTDACTVKILVTYSMDVPLPNVGRINSPAVLEEKWIALDGVWYHVPAQIAGR
ncbi:MAG TPA: hypothetical protein VND91_10240 [Candidatus Saccharimonadia bacterium]|nr:hypothetical protein [Candidatus Saccharimonadia bacterium]